MQNRFSANLAFCSALALSASATLVAQNTGGMPQQPAPQQTQPSMPNPGSQNGPQQSMGDQAFVSESMQGNMAEIQMAQLAQQKSQSADVKQLAQKLESEHTQMNQKWFEPEAKALSVSEPKGPSKKDKKQMEKLQALSGDQFDKAYITATLKDHQDDLKKYQAESGATQDPNVKQIAQMGTKVVSQHLQIAEQVAKSHNVPVEGGEVSSR